MKFIYFLFIIFNLSFSLPLDDYINKQDNHYTWQDTNIVLNGTSINKLNNWTGYVLNMTSQKWLTENDSSRSLWWHYLVVFIPDKLKSHEVGTLFITGGSNLDTVPKNNNEDIILGGELVTHTRIITAILFQVPNQPIIYPTDIKNKSRSEDAAIAFTWDHFLKNPSDVEWILRLPMTKAAVRAMDTVQNYVNFKFGHQIEKFIVSGASKRGWTTYFTAAVDKRVIGMIPIVMDMLNMLESIHHMYKAYGGWTFAFQDYYEMDIMSRLDDDNMKLLAVIEDPITYIDRFTMPKLVLNAANDEFFMADDILFWWSQLSEPKNWYLSPNTEHSYITGVVGAVHDISSWINNLIANETIPSMNWKIDETGKIHLILNVIPEKVSIWHATTADNKRRDFRIVNLNNPCITGPVVDNYCSNLEVLWTEIDITNQGINNTWSVIMDVPTNGQWIAFYLNAKFKTRLLEWPLEFSTGVSILPQIFPYEDCHGVKCNGSLV